MLLLYKALTLVCAPFLTLLMRYRIWIGKEDAARISERKGITNKTSPTGRLIWIHAASVGEAQSALILIKEISKTDPAINFLVTSGTKTSASLMEQRLPAKAIHQYFPYDTPQWVTRFLGHWQPDLVLWMESELWPNMLLELKERKIPAILINARLSDKSYKRWSLLKGCAKKILSAYVLILTQTEKDQSRFKALSGDKVIVSDNLKYSAAPLPYDEEELTQLKRSIGNRPVWLYASTHDGEETLATRLHLELKEQFRDLLTIIVPRHPERRNEISEELKLMGAKISLRGEHKNLPEENTDVYVADTLGELGLFYKLSPIAVIGRSFSHDGGGGHNPIEAAQLDCAVLTGPNIQYQTQLFADMFEANAAKQVISEEELKKEVQMLFSNNVEHQKRIDTARKFAKQKENIIHFVMEQLTPYINHDKKDAA